MKIVFSRKGFDSANGRRPSPIIEGRPRSLPIPERIGATSTFGDVGLGELVETVTRGRLTAGDGCHDDPMFGDRFCWFGQSGSAQGHLRNQGVGRGDVFLFFGLFADEESGERHHRIFGHLEVAGFGPASDVRDMAGWREPPRFHPHFSAKPRRQNTIYFGPSQVAQHASDALRLTRKGGPTSRWVIPAWLIETGLSRHGKVERWQTLGELQTVAIGQEFVCDISALPEGQRWLDEVLREISR